MSELYWRANAHKRTVCKYQSSRFKMLRRFQFMFLFTWQSATYQIIKKSSQHRILCHSIMRADFWLTATDCRFFKGWSILSNERPNSITATDYWRVTILSSWCFTTHIYIYVYIYMYMYILLVVHLPLWKNMKVSWDDDIPNIWRIWRKKHVPKHQLELLMS